MLKIRSKQMFYEQIKKNVDFNYLNDLTKKCISNNGRLIIKGYCEHCQQETNFFLSDSNSGIDISKSLGNDDRLNFRDAVICKKCKLNPRQIFMFSTVSQNIPENFDGTIYLNEGSGKFIKILKKRYKKIVGSEYFGANYPAKVGGILNEDACNLSFKNSTFDYIISNDVYEHVYDIDKALNEAFRVLKNHGKVFISIPFFNTEDKTVKRSDIIDGKLKYILEPQYHGSTRKGESKTLVFYEYGWDFLDTIMKAGFSDAYMLMNFDKEKIYLDPCLSIIVAEKNVKTNEQSNEYVINNSSLLTKTYHYFKYFF